MFALKNDTTTIEFDKQNYILTSVDYGTIDATHTTAKGINQSGERLVSSTLDTRHIEIVGFIKATTAADMKAKKAALYQMCNPVTGFTVLPDEATGLKCYATETVKFPPERIRNNERVASFVIDAFCPDPFFADVVASYRRIAQWIAGLVWPVGIPSTGFEFGTRVTSLIATLVNDGDVETGMLIYFEADAEIENPVLTNLATGEFIKLNRTLADGETVVVNTNYGEESVTSYTGDDITDVINDLDLDSTFLQAPQGETSLYYSADTNITSMRITIRFYQKYLGV